MVEAPWIALSSGLVIAMLVLGLNLLGDGLATRSTRRCAVRCNLTSGLIR
jgi:ABC-type dipeptide/oligopeptide/nickel transport system permease subunit